MKLKIPFTLFALVTISVSGFAQIEIGEYEKQIEANISELPTKNAIEVSSECGSVEVQIDDKIFSGGCAGTLVREYTFSDDCGNKATAMQFIKLIDTDGPMFPQAEAVIYAGVNAENAPSEILVEDNSGFPIKASFTDKKKKDHIIRTWKATDDCGNESTFEQKLMLQEEM